MEMNFFKESEFYRFKGRSCRKCRLRRSCIAMVNKDWSCKWLDLAKVGCDHYSTKK